MAHLPQIDYRHWEQGGGREGWHGVQDVRRVVIHDTESHDHAGIHDILGICAFWDRQNLGYGAHFIVDSVGNVGCYVPVHQKAWHAGAANFESVGIEIIGFAKMPKTWWLGRKKQLDAVARILAWCNTEKGIPLVRDLERGVLTHNEASKAYGGTHWDPGPGFPMTYVMYKARQIAKREP